MHVSSLQPLRRTKSREYPGFACVPLDLTFYSIIVLSRTGLVWRRWFRHADVASRSACSNASNTNATNASNTNATNTNATNASSGTSRTVQYPDHTGCRDADCPGSDCAADRHG